MLIQHRESVNHAISSILIVKNAILFLKLVIRVLLTMILILQTFAILLHVRLAIVIRIFVDTMNFTSSWMETLKSTRIPLVYAVDARVIIIRLGTRLIL